MSKELEKEIVEAIKKVYDPEIPVNIYELGLIYKIDVNEDRKVLIEMTLTLSFLLSSQSLLSFLLPHLHKNQEQILLDKLHFLPFQAQPLYGLYS